MHLVTLAIFMKSDHSQVWTLWTKFLLCHTIVKRADKIKIVLIPMPNNSLYTALTKQPLQLGQIEVDYKSRAQQNWWGTFGAQLRAYDNDVIQLFLLFADSTQPIKIQTTLGIVVPRPQVNFVANIWLILVTCFRFILSSNVAARTVLSKKRFENIKIMTISS